MVILEIEEKDRSIIMMFNHPESTKQIQLKERKMTLNLFIGSSIKVYKFQNNQFRLG